MSVRELGNASGVLRANVEGVYEQRMRLNVGKREQKVENGGGGRF
jgi:hypothetical protein